MKTIVSHKTAYSVLILLAAVALAFSAAGISHAYFTTFVTAHGTLPLELETEITIKEEFDGVAKLITIENPPKIVKDKDGNDQIVNCDCWVRIKVIAPPDYTVEWPSGGSWAQKNPDDGYWYYTSLLPVGAHTEPQFRAGIAKYPVIEGEEPPEFNIAVIAESIPGSEDMTWDEADWSILAPEEEAKK